MPSTKVAVATLIALLSGLAMRFGVEWPDAVEQILTPVLTLIVAYLVPESNPSKSAREAIAAGG